MTDKREHLDEWLRQALKEITSDQYTVAQKRELLSYQAGRCWGYAFNCKDPDVMRHGWGVHAEINRLRKTLTP